MTCPDCGMKDNLPDFLSNAPLHRVLYHGADWSEVLGGRKSPSPRQQVLDAAANAVLRDRNDTHGSPENTFEAIADLWDAYDQHNKGQNGRAHDVAMKLELVKVARIACGAPAHMDNYTDTAGYSACAYELAVKEASNA